MRHRYTEPIHGLELLTPPPELLHEVARPYGGHVGPTRAATLKLGTHLKRERRERRGGRGGRRERRERRGGRGGRRERIEDIYIRVRNPYNI